MMSDPADLASVTAELASANAEVRRLNSELTSWMAEYVEADKERDRLKLRLLVNRAQRLYWRILEHGEHEEIEWHKRWHWRCDRVLRILTTARAELERAGR
jgi:uncharacterized tellurite resistance protein B-like protein